MKYQGMAFTLKQEAEEASYTTETSENWPIKSNVNTNQFLNTKDQEASKRKSQAQVN